MTRIRFVLLTLAAVTMAVVLPGAATAQESASVPPAAEARIATMARLAVQAQSRMAEATRARAVPSPWGTSDAVGDAQPYEARGDLTAYQVRNGPNVFEIDFWLRQRPLTWNTGATLGSVHLDGSRNGLGRDYDLLILSSRQTGKFVAVGPPDFTDPDDITCFSSNVHDLGSSFLGYGYSVKIGRGCLGGRQGLSSRMLFLYASGPHDGSPSGDIVPSASWTPTVQPA